MFDSMFQYFTADEGQRLVLVYEESFDEAVATLKTKVLEKGEAVENQKEKAA